MKTRTNRLISLLALTMVMCLFALPALAAELVTRQMTVEDSGLPENDELAAMHVDRAFYGGISVYGRMAGDNLSGMNKALYDELKALFASIASGDTASTIVYFDMSDYPFAYTAASQAEAEALLNADIGKVMDALLSDCPFDLYWFDKTKGYGTSYYIQSSGNSYTFPLNYLSFSVASAYQADGYDVNAPAVNADKTGAKTAAANAKAIVDAAADMSDYDKLIYYRDQICELTEYNHAAAADSYTGGYGDPWQLVYVFDGEPSTTVVCEGYSKAFQYLCDLTAFDSDIVCYTVTGMMTGGTGAGGHMWNIVTMEDGQNYIVDVTNSDAGTVGQSGGLFLGGTSGSVEKGYTFAVGSQDVSFAYDSETRDIYTTDELTLAGSAYSYTPHVHDFSGEATYEELSDTQHNKITKCIGCGETETVAEDHAGGTATCKTQAACEKCSAAYGQLDMGNHESTKITYTDNGVGSRTHNGVYDCCGEVAVSDESHRFAGSQQSGYACADCGVVAVASVAYGDNVFYIDNYDFLVGVYPSNTPYTLTLYADETDSNANGPLNLFGSVTLDLNGKTLNRGLIVNGTKVIIKDSAGGGVIAEYSGMVIALSSGTLTLDQSADFAGAQPWRIFNTSGSPLSIGTDIVLPEGYVLLNESGMQIETLAAYELGTPHRHSFTYSAEGERLLQLCGDECAGSYVDILSPDSTEYDGTAKPAKLDGSLLGVDQPQIRYAELNENEEYGEEFTDAPVRAGIYVARISMGGATAELEFQIGPARLNAVSEPVARAYTASSMLAAVPLTLNNVIGVDEVSAVMDFELDSADVGTYDSARFWGYTLSGADADNYILDSVTFSGATITKAAADQWNYLLTSPQDFLAGGGLDQIELADSGTGIGGETVSANVVFYTDAQMTTEAMDADVTSLQDGDSITLYYAAETGNYESQTGSVTLNVIDHTHEWTYAGSGSVITMTCSGTIGQCPTPTVTITLLAPANPLYDGSTKEAAVTVNPANAQQSVPAISYSTADGMPPVDAGTYTAAVKMESATAELEFTVIPAQIGKPSSYEESGVYIGAAHTPIINIRYCLEGTDYTVTYPADMVNAGTKTLTITGKGNYTGSYDLSYEITPASIADAAVTAADQVYTGAAIEPDVTVTLNGVTLKNGVDYTAAYESNTNAGTAAITVTGKGNYEGTASGTFEITTSGAAIAAKTDKNAYTYGETVTVTATVKATGEAPAVSLFGLLRAAEPTMALYAGGAKVSDDVTASGAGEYVMTYNTADKAVAAGSAELTVRYSGDANTAAEETSVFFTLNKKEISVTLSGAAGKTYDGTTDVTDASGLALAAGGALTGDEIALSAASFAYDDANAGTGKTITAQGVTLSGADAAFYALSADTASAAIGEIARAQGSGSVSIAGWTYGETASKPVPTSNTNGTDNVTYFYAGTTNGGAAYGPSASVPTDAGSYTVTATFAQTINSTEATATADFTIAKAQPAFSEALTAVYGQKLSDVTLPAGWTWDAADTAVGSAGANAHAASYAGDDNHVAAQGVALTVTVLQSGTGLSAAADKKDYLYGESVTISVVASATKQQASVFSRMTRMAAPSAGTVTLYNGDVQLTQPQPANDGEPLSFVLNTVEYGLTPGSYALRAVYTQSSNMAAQEAEVSFTVSYLAEDGVPDALISGKTSESESGDAWYVEDPTLTAQEDTQVSADPTAWPADGTPGNSVTLPTQDGEHEYSYYIKNKDGVITEKKITVKADKNAPEAGEPAILTSLTTAEITVQMTDSGSGIAEYTLTQTGGEEELEITDNGNGSFTVAGMTQGKTYTFDLVIKDNAGHVTTIPVSVTAALMPSLPQTGDSSSIGLWLALMGAAGAALLMLRRRAYR